MRLRTKLLLGYSGFILALGLLGAWSARTLSQMSAVSRLIISENYDSVVAAQDMKESLERQDSAAVFSLLGEHERAARQAASIASDSTQRSTKRQRTSPRPASRRRSPPSGRAATTTTGGSTRFSRTSGDRTALYFRDLEPRFNAVRADCDRLLHLNQEAMRRKADRASAPRAAGISSRWDLALTLMVVGVAVEFSLSNAIVGPVRQLTEATTRVAAGDLDAAVPVQSARRNRRARRSASTGWRNESASCGGRISASCSSRSRRRRPRSTRSTTRWSSPIARGV